MKAGTVIRLALGIGAALAAIAAQATEVTVTLSPTADAAILDGLPSTPVGTGDGLSVYHANGNVQNSVLSFDLSAIPAIGTINSATLVLHRDSTISTSGDNGYDTFVFRVTSSWVESQVTWDYRDKSTATFWGTYGGDFVGTTGSYDVAPYAQATLNIPDGTLGLYTLNEDVTTLVAQWVNGTYPNNGLELTGDLFNHLNGFHSREATDPSLRPELIVDYTIPEPSLAMLLGLGGLLLWRRYRS